MKQDRKLPLGIQDFEEMRRDGYLYVDKTDMVWQLANGDKYNYLSRPRRFGKSLLCSTLKCYFEGRKDLFEGLKIMQMEKDWVKRPVIYLSMSLGGSSVQTLREYLHSALSAYEKIYGKNPDEQSLGNRLNGIIQRAYEQSGVQIAVIVDEYDVPLQHTFAIGQHDECREIYRNFFLTGLKDYGYCIKCVFVTGITKFTQISLFSMLNTLSNVSFDDKYSAMCGLTYDELSSSYHEEIKRLASNYGMNEDQTLMELKAMYDGSHFSRNLQNVYNPFSVLNALNRSRLNSYWIASGSNEMLNKVLSKFIHELPSLDGSYIDADYLEMSDVNMDEPKLFLYQSGYLTIKTVKGDNYELGYPNKEVRKAMYELVLPMLMHKQSSEVNSSIQKLKMHLGIGNVDEAMLCLKALIAETPYSTQKKEHFVFEEHFRFILKNILYLCSFEVKEELEMSSGRIDLVAEGKGYVYVMELKMDDNGGVDSATKQIQSRQYADIFAASDKKIISLAIEFSKATKGLKDWKVVKDN